jgi:hypothetical protein
MDRKAFRMIEPENVFFASFAGGLNAEKNGMPFCSSSQSSTEANVKSGQSSG